MAYDFASVFTSAARSVVPVARGRGISWSFDCRGPACVMAGDPERFRGSVQRLLDALLQMLSSGCVAMDAQTRISAAVHGSAIVKLGAVGRHASAASLDAAIAALDLATDVVPPQHGRPRLHRARGSCPLTGAPVEFSSLHGEGLLFSVVYALPTVPRVTASAAPALPVPRRAWLIGPDRVARETLSRRLLRVGFGVRGFDAAEPALRRLVSMHDAGVPGLVIVFEAAQASHETLSALQSLLPAGARCVLAVDADSPCWLGTAALPPGFDPWVQPFSPAELEGLAAALRPQLSLAPATEHAGSDRYTAANEPYMPASLPRTGRALHTPFAAAHPAPPLAGIACEASVPPATL